jgi:hypothetical protein
MDVAGEAQYYLTAGGFDALPNWLTGEILT